MKEDCDKIRELIPLGVSNDLNPSEMSELQEHLSGCPDCRNEFSAYQSLTKSVGQLAEAKPQIDDTFWSAQRQRILSAGRTAVQPLSAGRTAVQPCEQLRLGLLDSAGYGSLKGALAILFNKLGLNRQIPQPDNKLPTRLNDAVGQVATCELNFEEIVSQAKLVRPYQEFSRMPAISRDLAVVIDEAVLWTDIEKTVREAVKPSQPELPLESLDFFDLYRGKQVPAGKKSIAFSLTFRHPSQTLSAQKADEVMNLVANALQTKLAAQVRQK